ncbi:ABC transporter permease [Alkalibacter saccharofermentans]|uniref:Osmoprotectant transport system permease protein n=1 Tax=Alkalibacter saccharofermentans DSM 14828 TaxID=1120975 RepID=A0A1M4U1D0_9FIRM|nr:ABC transporter permease [Alkalibacter saccharofermentans]SHE50374.1 osmoprotectant transport system permease protein [Alkalibacter saccharofermentans DSM 14828]
MDVIIAFFDRYSEMLVRAIVVHLQYVFISVIIGFLIAFVLAILLSRVPSISDVVIPVLGILQTIPGLVFIGVLFIYLGIRPITIIVALSVYAVFPILKNTYTGIVNVDSALKEAARGCGMNSLQILYKVEIPMAISAIFAGLRMSTIYTVSWAVLAAMIGLGGLGEFIYRGIDTNNNMLIVGGAIPAAILAVLLGFFIDFIQKILTPRGLKGE